MKRIQINSRNARTELYLTAPITEPNQRYKIMVEKLVVPATDSLILNTPLFSIKRRVERNEDLIPANEDLPLAEQYTTFTPQRIRTVTDLIYQLNAFFTQFLKRIVTTDLPFEEIHQYDVPDLFEEQEDNLGLSSHLLFLRLSGMADSFNRGQDFKLVQFV